MTDFLAAVLAYSLYALALAYLAELLLGVPTWLCFRHYGIRSWAAFAAAGAGLGLLFYMAVEALVGNFGRYHHLTREFSPFPSPYLDIDVLAGLASAILFRVMVFSGQVQKTPK
ncbi:MAG: hypothetical protein WA188_06440 [Terriglobales bacterium]